MNRRLRNLVLVCLVSSPLSLGALCNGLPNIVITNPGTTSVFTTAPSIAISGKLLNISPAQVTDVTVNGVSVLPLGPGQTFSAVVSLDPGIIFNPVVAEVRMTSNKRIRDRLTVVAGDGAPGPGGTGYVLDGGFSPEGIALRLNDTGLNDAEPVIEGGVDLDLAALLPHNTYLTSLTFIWTFNIYVDATAPQLPPQTSGFSIDVDSQTNSVDGLIDVTGVLVDLHIDGTGFLAPDCKGRITSPLVNIDGNYFLDPDGVDPSNIDVTQNGNLAVNGNFDFSFTSGICDLGGLIELLIGDVSSDINQALVNFLKDPDGPGGPQDGPIADEIEVALADIEISGPIGQAIGVSLETPLFDVYEDTAGITLDSDARITASMPLPGAPDLPASYHVNESFPPFGATTPVGGLPYDLGLAISTSAFNQLLKAETESGLLRLTGAEAIDEFDLDGPGGNDPVPLSAAVLSAFIPQMGAFPPDKLFRIELKPEMGPIFTGEAGPLGELAELRIAHLLFELRDQNLSQIYLQSAVDVRVGSDIVFVPAAPPDPAQLSFLLGTPAAVDINVDTLINNVSTNVVNLETTLQFLLPQLLPSLSGSLGSFPLPDFLGLSLSGVEVGRNGQFFAVFMNLTAVP
jgi:hypothetical protein